MMGEEHCTEDMEQVWYRSLLQMLQDLVPDTVRARLLAEIEATASYLDLVRVG